MARAARIGAGAAGVLVVLLAAAQLLLPGIAARRIASRLRRFGDVASVRLHSSPAVKLLWGAVDSLEVRAGALALQPRDAARLLWEARGTERLELSAPALRLGALELSGVELRGRGSSLSASAHVSATAVAAALPSGVSLQLVHSGGGRVTVLARGSLFGQRSAVEARAEAIGGRLIVRALPPAPAVTLTLFSDPRLRVLGVGARGAGGRPASYALTISALRR